MEITGWAAIVSGGASGLGLETVRMLHRSGARVAILDLPRSGGPEIAAELGAGVVFSPGDVTDPDSVQAAVDAASALGPLRIAVAAAGVTGAPRNMFNRGGPMGPDHFRPVLDINVGGTINLVARAAQAMAETEPVDGERGVIVCTASVAAYDGQMGLVPYSAAKAAIAGMTLPAARELARHLVRVVSIAPGIFDTPILAGLHEEGRRAAAASVPHPARLGRAHEFAMLVEQIIRNPMLNGEVIRLDGAVRLQP